MKFNWGYRIAMVYILFVCGIMFMVLQSGRQKIDLVTEDYYEQEIRYQERIDQSGRSAALSEKLQVAISGQSLDIRFPAEFMGKKIIGKALLYYPADGSMDLTSAIATSNNGFRMELPGKRSGMHILKVTWESEGVTYYNEEEVFLP
jgi:hypothetical protein